MALLQFCDIDLQLVDMDVAWNLREFLVHHLRDVFHYLSHGLLDTFFHFLLDHLFNFLLLIRVFVNA